MTKTDRVSKLVWVCLLLLGTAGAFAQEEFMLTDEELASEQAGETMIDFYGRVVDQHGDPVVGAQISVGMLHIAKPPVREERVVETDLSGEFVIHWGKGSFLVINKIQRNGYEIGPKMYQYSYRSNWGYRHIPDESNPVVFKMRKRAAEPTFLFHHIAADLKFDESNGLHTGFDVIRSYVDPDHRVLQRFRDLEALALWEPGDATCEITLKANGDDTAGLILSDELLGLAPESGYQESLTLTFEDRKPVQQKYLYVRSRTPAIYSRFEIGGAGIGRDWLELGLQGHTNPYGERNLEMDEQFPGAASSHIEAMVRKAYRDNVSLDVAPLKELIEAAKGTTKEESLRISREVRDLEDKVEREERRNFEIDTATLTEMYRKAKKVQER